MGDKNIKQWIAEGLEGNKLFVNPVHEETMSEIYDVLEKEYEKPVRMDLLGVSRTYKLTFADGRIEKIAGDCDTRIEMQNTLYNAGLKVPKITKIIPWRKDGMDNLKLQKWIDGECLRMAMVEKVILDAIEMKYWHKLGALISEISTHRRNDVPITVCDIHWGNFIVDRNKEEVWLSDCRKLVNHQFPERWVYDFIIFGLCNSTKAITAFTDGYLSIDKKPNEIGDRLIRHTQIFTKGLYEKLA